MTSGADKANTQARPQLSDNMKKLLGVGLSKEEFDRGKKTFVSLTPEEEVASMSDFLNSSFDDNADDELSSFEDVNDFMDTDTEQPPSKRCSRVAPSSSAAGVGQRNAQPTSQSSQHTITSARNDTSARQLAPDLRNLTVEQRQQEDRARAVLQARGGMPARFRDPRELLKPTSEYSFINDKPQCDPAVRVVGPRRDVREPRSIQYSADIPAIDLTYEPPAYPAYTYEPGQPFSYSAAPRTKTAGITFTPVTKAEPLGGAPPQVKTEPVNIDAPSFKTEQGSIDMEKLFLETKDMIDGLPVLFQSENALLIRHVELLQSGFDSLLQEFQKLRHDNRREIQELQRSFVRFRDNVLADLRLSFSQTNHNIPVEETIEVPLRSYCGTIRCRTARANAASDELDDMEM